MFPRRRLLRVAVAWTVAVAALVLAPAFWPLFAAAAAVGLAVIAWDARVLHRATGIEIERRIPPRAFVGRPAQIEVLLRNSEAFDVRVDVVDEVPRDLAAADPEFADVGVAAASRVVLRYAVQPAQRGDRELGQLVALQQSPLRFWCRRRVNAQPQALRVYPDTARYLRPEALDPKRIFAAIGVRPSRRRGEGMEFESLREYVAGDDPRRLDWAASARRGRPITRLYRHERSHTVIVAVDASRLMGGRIGVRTKVDYAIEAALALVYAALVSGDRAGMVVFDRGVQGYLAPRSHRHEFGEFVELLRSVQPRLVEADYQALVRRLSVQQRQQALMVVITDFVEAGTTEFVEPLAVLARRHRVLLVAVRDRLYSALDPQARTLSGDDGLYQRIVLNDLLAERESALAQLRHAGLQTLDLTPESMTAAVLNRYLAMRYGPER